MNQSEHEDIRMSIYKLDEKTVLAKTKLEILVNEKFDFMRDTLDNTSR